MSLQVYHTILKKSKVDEFFGNEDKVREVISRLYEPELRELSMEIEVSPTATRSTTSLLKKEPPYTQRLFLKRLYEAEVPVTYKELIRGITHPKVTLTLLEEIRIVKIARIKVKTTRGYKSRKAIIEVNKPLIERYWPNIEKF